MTYNVKFAAENIKTIELLVEFQSPFSEVFGIPVPKTSGIDDLKDLIAISIGEGKKHIPILNDVYCDYITHLQLLLIGNFRRGRFKFSKRSVKSLGKVASFNGNSEEKIVLKIMAYRRAYGLDIYCFHFLFN